MRSRVLLATTLLVIPTTACGSDDGGAAVPQVPATLEVTFHQADFGEETPMTFDSEDAEVTCRKASFDPSVRTVRLWASGSYESYLTAEVLPVDEPTTYEVPPDAAGRRDLRRSVRLDFESEVTHASTGRAAPRGGRTGSVEVVEASCDPAVLRLRVDATMGAPSFRPIALGGGIDVRRK